MVEILRLQENRKFVIPAQAGIQVTDSVRHTVGKRYPGQGEGLDPGFHRGDDKIWMPAFAGMTDRGSRIPVNIFRDPWHGAESGSIESS
jgi:hypothetical protein